MHTSYEQSMSVSDEDAVDTTNKEIKCNSVLED